MWEDEELERPTSQYEMGTIIVYREARKRKITKPKYGYKFVQTQARKTRRKK